MGGLAKREGRSDDRQTTIRIVIAKKSVQSSMVMSNANIAMVKYSFFDMEISPSFFCKNDIIMYVQEIYFERI